MLEFSSSEAQDLIQPFPEAQTPDDSLFSSFWGYSSPVLDSFQQPVTPSTATISLPSTPFAAPSLVPSSPDCMQHYTIPASAMDTQDPDPTPTSPFHTPYDKRKKNPRPPNAFMIFRSWLIRGGKLPPEVEKRQQNISKIAGKAWRLLDEPSKDRWREKALELVEDHKKSFPDYKSEPSPKNCRTGLEKIRKAAKDSDDDSTRRLKALADVYGKDHQTVDLIAPRFRRERTSPYKFPTTPRTPQKSARGFKTSQLGSPSTSLAALDYLSPSSAQSLSPLPLNTRPNAFTQRMVQPPLPYTFLHPGLPNHFQQAYQQENGVCIFPIPHSTRSRLIEFPQTIVFPENYAPVNPFSPPPGWNTFDHIGLVPPVVNTNGMMASTVSNTIAAMLSLHELNPPYAHFNPNLGPSANDFPPTTEALSTPLSTVSLTPQEQEVFSAMLGNSQLPLALKDLIPSPLSFSENGFVVGSPTAVAPSSPSPLSADLMPSKELSFAKPHTDKIEGPALAIPKSPAANQCA